MLKLMRENTGSWIIKILLGLIVLVFVFLGMGSYGSKKGNIVASVNDMPITMTEYQRSYHNILEQMRSRFGDNLSDEIIEMLQVKKQALDRLIEDRLVSDEAARLEIEVSDQDVRDSLLGIPAFRKNGMFDMETYKRVLARNRMSPESFENMQKESLRQSQVRELVMGSIAVSDMEAVEWYRHGNTELSIDYLVFEPDTYKNIEPGDEKIKEFYEKHKENYKSRSMVKAEYLEFSPEDYKGKVDISPERLKAYYEENMDQFTIAPKVEARHILIKVAENAEKEDISKAEAEAYKVYEKAVKGEDFSELAKKFSQGPSRDSGGYLGSFTKDSMVKPFAEKAFSMEPGEISKPVKTRFGFHIIKVDAKFDESTTSFEDAEQGIVENLEKDEIKNLAYYDAGKAFDAIIDGDDLEQAGLISGKNVLKSEYFTKQGPKLLAANASAFAKSAFAMPVMEISDVKEIGDSYYIIKPVEKTEPAVLEFEKAKESVKKDLTEDLQREAAQKDAQNFLASLKENNDIQKAARETDLKVTTTEFFTRNGNIPQLGNSPEIVKAAFKLTKENMICQKVLKSNGKFYIISFNEKKVPDQAKIDENLTREKKQLAIKKQNSTYAAWIKELKANGTIEIEQGIID